MRATVLIDGAPKREAWMESETLTRIMAHKAEVLYQRRAEMRRAVQQRFNAAQAMESASHLERALQRACVACGVESEWILERLRSGSLVRGGVRAAARRRVWCVMRQNGLSYPEISAACGVGHSTVITSCKRV